MQAFGISFHFGILSIIYVYVCTSQQTKNIFLCELIVVPLNSQHYYKHKHNTSFVEVVSIFFPFFFLLLSSSHHQQQQQLLLLQMYIGIIYTIHIVCPRIALKRPTTSAKNNNNNMLLKKKKEIKRKKHQRNRKEIRNGVL